MTVAVVVVSIPAWAKGLTGTAQASAAPAGRAARAPGARRARRAGPDRGRGYQPVYAIDTPNTLASYCGDWCPVSTTLFEEAAFALSNAQSLVR